MGDSFIIYVAGLALGHCYIYVKDNLRQKYGRDYFPTPYLAKKIGSILVRL